MSALWRAPARRRMLAPIMRQLRVVVAAVLSFAAFALASAPAHAAGIWTQIPSGTSSDITGIAYQSDSRFWFVTGSGEIFTRQGDGTFARKFGPSSVALNDIAFQPGGNIGIAVGDAGQVLRSVDGGATWNPVTGIPVSKKGTTFSDCSASDPLGNVRSVRFTAAGRVYIFAEGAQMAKSEPATAANVGAPGTWVDANRAGDNTCKLRSADTGYSAGIDDGFFVPGNPDVGYICTGFFGVMFRTTDDLAGPATRLAGDCGNGGDVENRRIAGDPSTPSHQWAVGPGDIGGSYTAYTSDGWSTSSGFTVVNADAHAFTKPYDVAFAGGTAVAVGDGGMILNNNNGTGAFYNNTADGALATAAWHAVSLASGTQAAIGGGGGVLAVTTAANTIPDIVAPTGTIAGPATAVVGVPTTFTANVADNAGGSGINPASFVWTSTGTAGASGNPAAITFPNPGYYTVTVKYADNAGNTATATTSIQVSAAAIIPPPVTPTVTNKATTVSVSGGTVTLKSPKSCVPVGSKFTVTMSFKRKSTSRTGKVIKILSVVFYIDGKKKVTDKKAPFAQRLSVTSFKAGSTHKLKARATMKVRHGKPPTKSIQTTFKVCG